MIYIDTSCFLKLFRPEQSSPEVRAAVAAEPHVVVSVLTELETLVQLQAGWSGGSFTRPQWRRLETEVTNLRHQPPFEFRTLAAAVFQTALRQHRNSAGAHCRTLDRLHLAAMEELHVTRLMTHDERQAKAAAEASFEVVRPGRD